MFDVQQVNEGLGELFASVSQDTRDRIERDLRGIQTDVKGDLESEVDPDSKEKLSQLDQLLAGALDVIQEINDEAEEEDGDSEDGEKADA